MRSHRLGIIAFTLIMLLGAVHWPRSAMTPALPRLPVALPFRFNPASELRFSLQRDLRL